MKILMLSEYYVPFDFGGSEWSTHYLSKELVKKGHNVTIFTPNFGSKPEEILNKIKIVRFPFYKKISGNSPLSPYWLTGILWIITSTYFLLRFCKNESIDIIHAQGKYFAPSALVAKLIFKLPTLITTRDYQLICNYGFCLWDKDKNCGLLEYFTRDFRFYVKNYLSNSSIFPIALNAVFALNGRLVKNFYSFTASKLDKVVCISKTQSRIYKTNGYKNVSVIYNSMDFKRSITSSNPKRQLIFVGRLTPGKGVSLLFETVPNIAKKFKDIKIRIIGEGILKSNLQEFVSDNGLEKIVRFEGRIEHRKLLKIYSESLLTIAPSIWPEPFGRVALESLSKGTPVIVTNKGGLKEIIENFPVGYVSSANSKDLGKFIEKGIINNGLLRSNIVKHYPKLVRKYQKENINKYISVYGKIV